MVTGDWLCFWLIIRTYRQETKWRTILLRGKKKHFHIKFVSAHVGSYFVQ